MQTIKFTDIEDFAGICAAMGENEQTYAIPEQASNGVKKAICEDRLKLISKVANGEDKVDLTDPDQWIYTPIHRKITDAKAPFGFRLSFGVCGCDYGFSDVGARPPFVRKADAIHAGQQFPDEFAQWLYYTNLAYQE